MFDLMSVDPKVIWEIYHKNREAMASENVSPSDKNCFIAQNELLLKLYGRMCFYPSEKLAEKGSFNIGDIVILHPFKTDDFYEGVIKEINNNADKPFYIQFNGNETIWVYPVEIQTVDETYPIPDVTVDNCILGTRALPKFKLGDIVRIVFDGSYISSAVKVKDYHYISDHYEYQVDSLWFPEDYLNLANNPSDV